MNIFAVSNCPKVCAKFLDDKRINKMLLETTQMLCTAINESGGKTPYKSSYVNHPCNLWARKSLGNWNWLYDYALELSREYTFRRRKVHKCQHVLDYLIVDRASIPEGCRTPFPNCTNDTLRRINFQHIKDVNLAYRMYLSAKWTTDKRKPTWQKKGA